MRSYAYQTNSTYIPMKLLSDMPAQCRNCISHSEEQTRVWEPVAFRQLELGVIYGVANAA